MIFGQISTQAQILLFLFFALTIAIILKQLQSRYKSISYTPTLFIVSVLIGYFSDDLGVAGQAINNISQIDPRGILILFLPPLIFQSAFNSDWHIFRKQSMQIFILAFPAVLVSALFIMISIKYIIGYDDSFYNWTQAFMFGSVLSCTDTVAVLALLKQAGAPKKFNSLIEGESLFNDGSCMVLITISFSLIKGQSPHPLSIGILFLQLTIGGIVLGIIFGIIASGLIKLVRNDSVLVLNITLASCYILYFVAQYVDLGIRVSGIMSLVSLGLYMAAFGKTKIPLQPRQKIQNFWKVVIYVAQSIIFIIGGLLVGSRVLGSHQIKIIGVQQFYKLGALYFCMMGARFFSISIFMPKLKNQGYGLKWNEVCVLTYGGLRGAVGVAFTLIIASDRSLNQNFTFICLFNMAGCSILTLVINASTASFVIRKVGLCVKSQTKTRLFIKFMVQCLKDLYQKIADLKKNKYLTNSDWQKVQSQSGILNLKDNIKKIQGEIRVTVQQLRTTNLKEKSLNANLLDDHVGTIDENLMMEIRNRFCIILKGILWNKFEDNQCSIQTIRVLIQCVDWDLDTLQKPLNSWDFILSHIHNPNIFVFCFWCKKYPIIRNFADSLIFQRAGFIYDIVSTYIQALLDCENKAKQLPFEQRSLNKLIQQSTHNRQFAQKYLKEEIIISYPEIMKKIQTNKAAQSILTFQKNQIKNSFKFGQLEDYFYKKLQQMVQKNSILVQNDWKKQIMSDQQILLSNQFFKQLTDKDISFLLDKKIEITRQKDQAIIKSYENTKYLYLITRGQVYEQVKYESKSISKISRKIYEFVGLSSLILKSYKKLQHSANANSIVCMFAFPIQEIHKIILNSPKLEGILQKQLIIFYAKYYDNFPYFSIDKEHQKFKQCLDYIYLPNEKEMTLDRCRIFLIEGKLVSESENFSTGYYDIKQNDKWSVRGPAKVFIIEDNFFNIGKMSAIIRKSEDIKRRAYDDKLNEVIDRALYT